MSTNDDFSRGGVALEEDVHKTPTNARSNPVRSAKPNNSNCGNTNGQDSNPAAAIAAAMAAKAPEEETKGSLETFLEERRKWLDEDDEIYQRIEKARVAAFRSDPK